jgi:hypothetical protein
MALAFAIIVRSFVTGVEENKSRALFSFILAEPSVQVDTY